MKNEIKNQKQLVKAFALASLVLLNTSAYAAEGVIQSEASSNESFLRLTISGDPAAEISDQLTQFGKEFRRDPWSGRLVQKGTGIRCLKGDTNKPVTCEFIVRDAEVSKY